MGRSVIPVDLHNPGQVFACMGFLEAADILCGPAQGGFDWSDGERFILTAGGTDCPVAAVLGFLANAEVRWLSPDESTRERDGGETVVTKGISRSSDPAPADLPGMFIGRCQGILRSIPFGYWADGSGRFNTTFKKSTYAASSHVRLGNALDGIRTLERRPCIDAPFHQYTRTQSLFRWDPRGSADPIHSGTSPDKLRKGGIDMRVATYPACEALAVVGLEHARPKKEKSNLFSYCVWSYLKGDPARNPVLLEPTLARAALNDSFPFLVIRRFAVEHEEVQKGGDRKMSSIVEEFSDD